MYSVAFAIAATYFLIALFRFAIGTSFGLVGFTKTSNGKIHHSIGTMVGHITVLLGGFELFSWLAERHGGAFIFGVMVGIYIFFVLPLQVVYLAWPKS